MEPRKRRLLRGETHPPTRRDRVIVLLVSLSFFVLLLIPLAEPIHASLVGWIVMIAVIGLPVVTINVLLPFSRWEQHHSKEPPMH
jgi:pilus assembly protein TadC